jgi:uncharacterized membrane protein (DUF485 family)
MSTDINIKRLLDSPELACLCRKRLRVVSYLSAAMFLVYAVYFLAIAFLPDLMGSKLTANGTVTIYIWFTVFIILFSVITSAYYAWWANKYFDPFKQKLLQELGNEEE